MIPSPDPAPAAAAMRQALVDARINCDQVDHVNAHATSTPVGDAAEAAVLRVVLEKTRIASPCRQPKA